MNSLYLPAVHDTPHVSLIKSSLRNFLFQFVGYKLNIDTYDMYMHFELGDPRSHIVIIAHQYIYNATPNEENHSLYLLLSFWRDRADDDP